MSERDIFDAALAIEDPDQRAAYLDRACAGDRRLRERLDGLLSVHAQVGSFLESPALAAVATVDDPISERPGTVIGSYKLLEQIGEGGFGVVFMAEQTQPIRRKVALKILKPGMDTRQVVARFEAERQALAIMDHPHIAHVFDGGETVTGRPYFVMELVRGIPITDFCDQNSLSIRDRLDLFVNVCQAVQHAHQKGIIHRDIKPSNVMVTLHDGTPVVKVIDFGIAKATGQQLTDKTLFTHFAQMIGTPLYMSPEQAGMSGLDVDTRSDIYSLGVLLYELLTGTTPFDKERLHEMGYDEMRRIIREEEPAKPSTRISTMGQAATTISSQRQSDPKRMSQLFRGELDWIVMKCLDKDRNRRYETTSALMADAQRYLHDEPVLACPPSAPYRLRKFLRKHRAGVATAAALAGVLLAGATVSTWQAVRATLAEAKSERRLGQMEKAYGILDSIFADLDPRTQAKGSPKLREQLGRHLERAAAQLDVEAVGDPLTVARLQVTLGGTLRALGQSGKAIELLGKARATLEAQLGPDDPVALNAVNALALAYDDAGRRDQAVPLFQDALTRSKARLGPDHPLALGLQKHLADAYQAERQPERAVPLLEDALERSKARLGADHPDTVVTMNSLGEAYRAIGQPKRAIPLLEQALQKQQARLGPDHPDTLATANNLGLAYFDAKDLDRALPLLEQGLKRAKAQFGPDHPDTLNSMVNLAEVYKAADRPEKALPLFEQALKECKAQFSPEDPRTIVVMNNLGMAYLRAGQPSKAVALLEEALAKSRARLGPDHPQTLEITGNLAGTYLRMDRPDKALPLFNAHLAGQRKRLGADDPRFASALAQIGNDLLIHKQFVAAEKVMLECLAVRDKKGPDDWTTFNTRSLLGAALLGQEKYAEAEPLLIQGYEGMKQREANIPAVVRKTRLLEAIDRIVRLYDAWDRKDNADAWRQRLNAAKKE